MATCIQHEIDHLNGVLFIDYLSKLKKDMIIKRLKKKKKKNLKKYPLNFMSLKIIFMGTPQFAMPILKSINKSDHHILCVYTQPPKKSDRGLKKKITPIHEYSNKKNLEIRHPKILDLNEIKYIKNLNPDVVVVVAYGKILPTKLLSLDKIKFINVHASLLPNLEEQHQFKGQ